MLKRKKEEEKKENSLTKNSNKNKRYETDQTIWGECTPVEAKLAFQLQEGCSFNEVACLLGRPSTITVFAIIFCDVYSLTRCTYLSAVKQLHPTELPNLFRRLLNHSKNIGDLDFSLNLKTQEEEEIEPSANYDPKGQKRKIFNEPEDKMMILRRNLFYIKRLVKNIKEKNIAGEEMLEHNQNGEKKMMNIKPTVFYDWDCEKIKQMPKEKFLEFWNTTEGFFAPVSPLSISRCPICHKKNYNENSYLLPLHKRVCSNEQCKKFGRPILSKDEIQFHYNIENLPIIFNEEDIPDPTQHNHTTCETCSDLLPPHQGECINGTNENDLVTVKHSLNAVNAKIEKLKNQIYQDNEILESLKIRQMKLKSMSHDAG